MTFQWPSDVWGFDEDAVKALKTMDPPDNDKQLINKYAILLAQESKLLNQIHITVSWLIILLYLL